MNPATIGMTNLVASISSERKYYEDLIKRGDTWAKQRREKGDGELRLHLATLISLLMKKTIVFYQ